MTGGCVALPTASVCLFPFPSSIHARGALHHTATEMFPREPVPTVRDGFVDRVMSVLCSAILPPSSDAEPVQKGPRGLTSYLVINLTYLFWKD